MAEPMATACAPTCMLCMLRIWTMDVRGDDDGPNWGGGGWGCEAGYIKKLNTSFQNIVVIEEVASIQACTHSSRLACSLFKRGQPRSRD